MNPKILVVDDEKPILRLLDKLLSDNGFDVVCTTGGREALEIFASKKFEAVISDMKMPEMDGLELLRRIKALDKHTEVIILTGHASLDNAIEAFKDEGAFHYLRKPLDSIGDLLITVERALERRRLKIENTNLLAQLKHANEILQNLVEERTRELAEAKESLKRAKPESIFDMPLVFMELFGKSVGHCLR